MEYYVTDPNKKLGQSGPMGRSFVSRLTVNAADCGFNFQEIKYLIFLFLRSGNEAMRGVQLRHSTRIAPRTFSVSKVSCL